MTETVSSAVEKRDNSAEAFVRQYERQFANVLPAHIQPETFMGLAIGALHRNPDLAIVAQRNRASFRNALLDCARLGHEPGTESYYLVPFGAKGNRPEVVGIEGYRGMVERMYRAGAISSIIAELVYEHDEFAYRVGVDKTPVHQADWFSDDRGEIRGAYAFAVFRDGAVSKVIRMSVKEIHKHRDASPAAKAKDSPWNTWPESMYLKTVLRQLEKVVPTSAEYRREQLRAAMEAQRLRDRDAPVVATTPDHDPDTGEVLDGEVVSDGSAGQSDSAEVDTPPADPKDKP